MGVVGISIPVVAIYSGYIIPKPSMIGALRWLAYINVRRVNDTFLTFR